MGCPEASKLVREQEAKEWEGGPSYSSGAFNEEEILGPKPLKRRKRNNK